MTPPPYVNVALLVVGTKNHMYYLAGRNKEGRSTEVQLSTLWCVPFDGLFDMSNYQPYATKTLQGLVPGPKFSPN